MKERFPHVDFILRFFPKKELSEFLDSLRKDGLGVYEKGVFLGGFTPEEILISRNGRFIAAVYFHEESVAFGSLRATCLYIPTNEGRNLLKKIQTFLASFTFPRNHILLKLATSWNEFQEYRILPDEFTRSLIPELFYGVDVDKLARAFLLSSQNILILFGEPGTGKSKFIQYVVGRSCFILEKTVSVLAIKGTENIRKSADNPDIYLENDLVVFDDFDILSLKRGEDSDISNVVSTILSVTDGFIPKRPKIIISTNKTLKEIDPALLRPSRLFDILELRAIPKDYYQKLCSDYPELKRGADSFKDQDSLRAAEIFDFIDRCTIDRDYLKDKNISKKGRKYTVEIGFRV
jgi:hypothetical protein